MNAVFTPRPTCGSLAQEKPPLVLHLSSVPAWDALALVPVPPVPPRIRSPSRLGCAVQKQHLYLLCLSI